MKLKKYTRTSIISVTDVKSLSGLWQGWDISKGPRAVSPSAGGLSKSINLLLGSLNPITVSSRIYDNFTVRPPEVRFAGCPLANGVDNPMNKYLPDCQNIEPLINPISVGLFSRASERLHRHNRLVMFL